MKRIIRAILSLLILLTLAVLIILGFEAFIKKDTSPLLYKKIEEVSPAETVIVLGASVFASGRMSAVLKERVDTAFELYQRKKVKRFLLSGDHRSDDYDEVNTMKNYLLLKGVPAENILLDHSGFDTYDSMYRSKTVFDIKDAIVVTQKFHLPRALFIAKHLKLDYKGLAAKQQNRSSNQLLQREKLANFKALWEVVMQRPPKSLH